MAIFRNITHRLKSEEKYRVLVNQILAVVYKTYADCNIDLFNNKVAALTRYTKEDFDSRKLEWKKLILPENLPEAKQRFIDILKTNKTYVVEYRTRRKNQEIRWIHNQGNIFCDAADKIKYISGILCYITDRKQAEKKLYRANQALRALGEVNQALVHATEEKAFSDEVCQITVKIAEYTFPR